MSHEQDPAKEVQKIPQTFLVVSDHPYWTALWEKILPQFGSFESVTLPGVEERLKEPIQKPDVILVDITGDTFKNGISLLKFIREACPHSIKVCITIAPKWNETREILIDRPEGSYAKNVWNLSYDTQYNRQNMQELLDLYRKPNSIGQV